MPGNSTRSGEYQPASPCMLGADGRDMLLRSTLNLLQEREFKQGSTTAKGLIECAFMTTNRYIAEILDSSRETLLAFIDRRTRGCLQRATTRFCVMYPKPVETALSAVYAAARSGFWWRMEQVPRGLLAEP